MKRQYYILVHKPLNNSSKNLVSWVLVDQELWKWFSWVVLSQILLGVGQDVSQGFSHLKTWWIWPPAWSWLLAILLVTVSASAGVSDPGEKSHVVFSDLASEVRCCHFWNILWDAKVRSTSCGSGDCIRVWCPEVELRGTALYAGCRVTSAVAQLVTTVNAFGLRWRKH